MRVSSLLISLLAIAMCLQTSRAFADPTDTATGVITGSVLGEKGPIQGATVSITGPASASTSSDQHGGYVFMTLAPGTYQLTAKAPGYLPLASTSVVVTAGTAQTLNVSLSRASLTSLRTIASTSSTGRGAITINTSGATIEGLTSQDFLDRGNAQVEDMLEELPGVELTRAGGAPGSNTDLSIRGATPFETQTLVDGHPVLGGRYGEYLIQFANPNIFSDIEIEQGPGVMGDTIANAVGGVANFRTPPITNTLLGQLSTGYDSFYGSTYAARVSDTIGKLGFEAAYAFYGTPGYFTGDILSVNASAQSIPGMKPPDASILQAIPASQAFQNRSQVFKLAYNFSPNTTLTLGSIGSQSYVDYTSTLTSEEPFTIVPGNNNPSAGNYAGHTVFAASTEDDLYLGNFELDNEPIFTGDLRTTIGPGSFLARYYAGALTRDIDDPEEAKQVATCTAPGCYPITYQTPYYQNEVDRLHGADFQYALPFGNQLQDLGIASYDQHSDESLYCTGQYALFTSADCPVNNLVQRSQTFSLRAMYNVLPKVRVGFGNYFSSTTFVGDRYDPRATIVWTPQRQTALRFAVGTAYVAPPTGYVAPVAGSDKVISNDTLYVNDLTKPETSAGVDLGADFGVHGDSKFSVDVYRTALTDRFSTATIKPEYPIPGNAPFGYYDGKGFSSISEAYNAADAIEQGVEFSYVRKPRVGIQGKAYIDLLRAYNYNTALVKFPGTGLGASQTPPDSIGGDGNELPGYQIPGFPYSHGRLEIGYKWPSTATMTFGASIYGADNSFGEPGFSLFDFGANVPLRGGVRGVVSVSNIFDHDNYRTFEEYSYGYIPPGEPVYDAYPLLFTPPRTITFQLVYPFGGR